MSASLPEIQLAERYFNSLSEHGIAYCILRNAEEVQQGDAHDIDMTVDAKHLAKAEALLKQAATDSGWKKHLQTGTATDPTNIKCYHYYLADEGKQKISILHIDIFPTFTWKGYILLDNKALLQGGDTEGIYRKAAPATESVCNLFVRLLFNGYVKDKYKESIQRTFSAYEEDVMSRMQQFLTAEKAQEICRHAQQGEWTRIEQARSSIIRNIRKTAPRKRLGYLFYLLRKALCRKGAVIAFMGTDGSGKSTIINGLPQIIGNTFSGDTIDYYHWRPGFIKPEKKLTAEGTVVSNVQPHTQKPYGKLISLLKMGMYVLDYTLGYWLKVRWKAAKGHLVVFDRYYYDFYMDKIRYRLSVSNSLVRLCQWFIPKPDATFLLIGDAQQIYERKKELPVEEVQAQIDCLKRHKNKFAHPVEVDVSQSIPQVLYSVSKELLQVLHKRNG